MTKKQIVQMISEETGLTQLQTKDIVDLTFEAIVKTLLAEGRIELRNFGVFEVKQRKARKARNPRTGDKVDVPPKNVVTFKPGKEMEEKVRKLKKIPRARSSHRDENLSTPLPFPTSTQNGMPLPGSVPSQVPEPVVKTKPVKPRKTT